MSDLARVIVVTLIDLIADLVRAGDDAAKQEAALMRAEERIARERAIRKFGGRS